MTSRPPAGVHWALIAVQLSFSGFHVFGKVVLESVDPLAVASLRVLVATPLLFLLAARHGPLRVPRRELPQLALLGLFGVFANQVLFVTGLRLTTATNAAILMPAIPVFAAGLAVAAGIERLGWRRLTGVALAVAGALALLRPGRFSLGDDAILGNLLILANCLSYAAFLVLQRPLVERLPWRTVLAWAFAFGGLGVLAVGGPTLAALAPAAVPSEAWAGLLYILAFPTALAYSLNTWAIRRSSPTLAAAYVTAQPLTTALLAALLLAERPGWREAAGFLLIAAGLTLVSRRRAPATPSAAPTAD